MNSLISIIIPMYNAEKYVSKCLNSLINQSYKNLEIIVINDGSKDNSKKIVEKFIRDDNRIILYNQDNKGVSFARNKGLSISSGDYIVFVDADDFVEYNYVETLYDSIIRSESDMSICNYVINDNQSLKENSMKEEIFNSESAIINMLLANKFDSSVCCKLIKSKIAKSELFRTDLLIAEDLFYYYNLLKKCKKISYVDCICYHYMQNENGAISTLSEKKVDNLYIFEEMLSNCKNTNLRNAICSKYVSTCFHFLSLDISKLPDDKIDQLKNTIKRFRFALPFKKNVKFKVRIACILSFFGFRFINALLKKGKGR